jgi:multisubunit Na+/H+ antiporter MnhC subunit
MTAPVKLRRRALAAVARSTTADRATALVIGLVLIAAGVLVLLLSHGVFGVGRASRPLLDPMIVDALRAQPLAARLIAIAVGLVLAVLGLVGAARSLRPEARPDVRVDGGPDTRIVVSSAAAAEAVGQQAAQLPGVGRARARLVGPEHAPALRLTVWLAEDADVASVLAGLESHVLATARESLELAALPVAVRLELDSAAPAPRVA